MNRSIVNTLRWLALGGTLAALAACSNPSDQVNPNAEMYWGVDDPVSVTSGVGAEPLAVSTLPKGQFKWDFRSQGTQATSSVVFGGNDATPWSGFVYVGVFNKTTGETLGSTTYRPDNLKDFTVSVTTLNKAPLCLYAYWELENSAKVPWAYRSSSFCQPDGTQSGADLWVEPTQSATVAEGGSTVMLFNTGNFGPLASGNPTKVSFTVPAGVQVLEATGVNWACSSAGNVVTCTTGGIGWRVRPISLNLKGVTAGEHSIPVAISSGSPSDPNTGNNAGSLKVTVTGAVLVSAASVAN